MNLLCTKLYKDFTKKPLEPINDFSEVAEYKGNTQDSIAFPYVNKEKPEREITKTIPFTVASQTIKYLGINQGHETLVL